MSDRLAADLAVAILVACLAEIAAPEVKEAGAIAAKTVDSYRDGHHLPAKTGRASGSDTR